MSFRDPGQSGVGSSEINLATRPSIEGDDGASSHVELPKKNELTVLLHDLPKQLDAEGREINATTEWDKAKNEFGSVEYKLFKSPHGSGKLIMFIPGIGGSFSSFDRFVKPLVDQGYDVAMICRNGTVVNEANSEVFSCPSRIALGQELGEEYVGDLPDYGYNEWTQEMACAIAGLGEEYSDVIPVGHSTGGLIGLESIRLLQEKRPDLLRKISRFVSLNGMVGPVETDEVGERWLDKENGLDTASLSSFFDMIRNTKGGFRMKDSTTLVQESYDILDRLHNNTNLPPSIIYSILFAEDDKSFSPRHAFDLAKKVGPGAHVWYDRAEDKEKAHSLKRLTPKALLEMIMTDDKRFKIIHTTGPLGPELKGKNGN